MSWGWSNMQSNLSICKATVRRRLKAGLEKEVLEAYKDGGRC